MNKFKGTGVALVTPFRKEGEVDFIALQKLVEFQIENGVNYLVVQGTTGESVTLNASELLSQGKEEQEKLREELKTVFDEMVYNKLAEQEAALTDNVNKTNSTIPAGIFVG